MNFSVDVERLQGEAAALIAEYGLGHIQHDPKAHDGDWHNLNLQSCGGLMTATAEKKGCHYRPTALWNDTRMSYIRSLLEPIAPAILRARLSTVVPGGIVYYHVDPGKYSDISRIHIPITRPSAGYTMLLGGEPVVLEPGTVTKGDFGMPHTLWNFGVGTRTTLLVDVYNRREHILKKGALGEALLAINEDHRHTQVRDALNRKLTPSLNAWRRQGLMQRKYKERLRAVRLDRVGFDAMMENFKAKPGMFEGQTYRKQWLEFGRDV